MTITVKPQTRATLKVEFWLARTPTTYIPFHVTHLKIGSSDVGPSCGRKMEIWGQWRGLVLETPLRQVIEYLHLVIRVWVRKITRLR